MSTMTSSTSPSSSCSANTAIFFQAPCLHHKDAASTTENHDLVEKTTGFDASPYAGRDENLSRHATRTLGDPRSALTQITSSVDRRPKFSHALSRQVTGVDVLVNFDGPNDPYRPLNWTPREKALTVLLYGLTTMCSSWGTSMHGSWAEILSLS